jgi:protocatechuate 3,4-dioxygenase beta subunit
MKLSRTAVSLAATLPFLPALLVAALAQTQKEGSPAQPKNQASEKVSPENRRRRESGIQKFVDRGRSPDARPWNPVIPATIPIRVSGVARDESGKPVAGATITLYPTTLGGAKLAGQATTDADGRYSIHDAIVPVQTSFSGHPFPKEITPYAGFILAGIAPGLGISWSPAHSVYAVEEPHPDDVQRRLPFGQPVVLDMTFPTAASLTGKVVDETGAPVEGAKLQVSDCDLLDSAGGETNNRQGYNWAVLPDRIGRAVTDNKGRFRIEGLADRACYWIFVRRPETDNASLGFYAATIDGPDTVHEQLPAASFNGRGRHDVKTGDLTVTFPKIRPIAVTVVAEDTGKPVAGAGVYTLNQSLGPGISSGGTTDAAGKVLLGLPPGRYAGIRSDPPIESRYIRTNQRPLVVERGEGAQPYELRLKAGVELIIQAVRNIAGEPVADAFFWQSPDGQPDDTKPIETSTFWSSEDGTNAKGELRAVLAPEPGRLYRFRFAGIHDPNRRHGIDPAAANKHGYEAFPTQSAPVELIAGKTIRLRFILHKTE